MGVSSDLEVGQTVLAIGNPFGLDTSLSVGIISAVGRSMEIIGGRRIFDVIQTDAAINPGNSGGPLLDSSGQLVGINTAIVSPNGAYAGIGFAVPVDTMRRIVPQLVSQGRVTRAGLGVQFVPDHITERAGVVGAAILKVTPQSAAGKAGLRGILQMRFGQFEFGDVIIAIDGGSVRNSDDYFAIMDRHRNGDLVRLTVRRKKAELVLEAILQEVTE
jgi:S1-C subfamily serine protease